MSERNVQMAVAEAVAFSHALAKSNGRRSLVRPTANRVALALAALAGEQRDSLGRRWARK